MVFWTTLTSWGQSDIKVAKSDSVEIKQKIETFYSWYGELIKGRKVNKHFNPNFIRRKDGMTTLNFTKYQDGLRKHHFTNSFIDRKVKEYGLCVDNLNKIKYETFLKFEGLDQFEEINCAFTNAYEWTSDMEPHDGAELISLTAVNKNTMMGTICFYKMNKDGLKYLWDYKQGKVTFVRQGKGWKIDDLKIERLEN
jgi:hypothetical protein